MVLLSLALPFAWRESGCRFLKHKPSRGRAGEIDRPRRAHGGRREPGLAVGQAVGNRADELTGRQAASGCLPDGVSWRHLIAGGILGGIGFTMALFIAELALIEPQLDNAKVGVLAGYFFSAVVGMAMLKLFSASPTADSTSAANRA
jgi:hypothetical protein